MELFRFIKWQWNRFHYDEIVLGLGILITVSVFAYLWYTVGFVTAFMAAIGTFFGIVILAMIGQQIRKQWRLYKVQEAQEAQRIVDKLRGNSR